jgi:hypothetical protein
MLSFFPVADSGVGRTQPSADETPINCRALAA